MGLPVTPDDQKPAAYYNDIQDGQNTTATRKAVPGGALSIEIGMFPTSANPTTAKFVFVVFNALSDAEEDVMLATNSTRFLIPTGEFQRFTFPPDDPCRRYAFRTDAATETNGSRIIQRIGSLL